MRKLLLVSVSLFVLLFAFGGGPGRASVEAAPAGAATGQVVTQQTCLGNGFVQVTFVWNPSGLGQQWMDVSASPVFNGYANFGPLQPNVNAFNWAGLLPNTTYYSRISTWAGFWLTSDTIAFTTSPCGGGVFTPPSNPTTSILGPNSVLFHWTAGTGNQFYCVDTAFSLSDLTTFSGSWHNWGCGTTSTSLEVDSIACGVPHYWRVYAWGPGGSGYSYVQHVPDAGLWFHAGDEPPQLQRDANERGLPMGPRCEQLLVLRRHRQVAERPYDPHGYLDELRLRHDWDSGQHKRPVLRHDLLLARVGGRPGYQRIQLNRHREDRRLPVAGTD